MGIENPAINWQRISSAILHYTDKDYKYQEVPWIVSRETTDVTFNGDAIEIYDSMSAGGYGGKANGDLVGSAEQSFIHLALQHRLSGGLYVACTPCFRSEQYINRFTRPYFMKVELFCLDNPAYCDIMVGEMISDAVEFFEHEAEQKVEIIKTIEGHDIMLNGIEVGSYGVRKHNGIAWAYGTGLAEPRFEQAIQLGLENAKL